MKCAVRFALIALLAGSPLTAATESGSLCIAAAPAGRSQFGLCMSGNLSLRIDSRTQIPWPHRASITVDDLNLNQSHFVVAICDAKPIQSFHFTFSEMRSPKLCVTFDPMFDGYEGLRLWDARHARWCKCR